MTSSSSCPRARTATARRHLRRAPCCETYPAARAAYLDAFTFAPPRTERPPGAVVPRINGSTATSRARAETSSLPSRAAATGGNQRQIWRALATAYQIAGWDERRAAHLGLWNGKDLDPPRREDLVWLGRSAPRTAVPRPVRYSALALAQDAGHRVAAALSASLLPPGRAADFTAWWTSWPPAMCPAEPRLCSAPGTLVRQGPLSSLAETSVRRSGAN